MPHRVRSDARADKRPAPRAGEAVSDLGLLYSCETPMPLAAGSRLGAYEILAPLDGRNGEV